MPLDLAALTAPEWVRTSGLGEDVEFGCIPLAPGDFDSHAATLFGLVAGVGGPEHKPRKSTPADLQNVQVIACLTVRWARKPGEDAQPLRLVLSSDDHDPANGRLWVGHLPTIEVGEIAGAGIKRYIEAAARAARFRRGPETPAHAGRDGEAVRPDSGQVAGAAK